MPWIDNSCVCRLHESDGDPFEAKAIEAALKQAYHTMEEELQKNTVYKSGSTSTTVIVTHSHVIFGFIGDSCAMLSRNSSLYYSTRMHNLDELDERERVRATKARIKNGMVYHHSYERALGMTRAFGNFDLKEDEELAKHEQAVISTPEIKVIKRCDTDDFLCLASDGVWNYMKHGRVHRHLHRRKGLPTPETVLKLAKKAHIAGSPDNISIVMMEL